MTINNKSERNYRGKCLGLPVTSYGGDIGWIFTIVFFEFVETHFKLFVVIALVCFLLMRSEAHELFLRFGVTFVHANLCSHKFTTLFLGWEGGRGLFETFSSSCNNFFVVLEKWVERFKKSIIVLKCI